MAHDEITDVITFSPPRFWLDEQREQYTWEDIIMYRVFYPLLERIDKHYLIVVNECLRTQNRSELTYNCLHHYLNQTPHRLIFEYFPFIERADDFMILADMDHVGRYKGRGFGADVLKECAPLVTQHHLSVLENTVEVGEKGQAQYLREKEKLFDNLGSKDPDTIPRQLHVWAGRFKQPEPGAAYVARNSRFKADNVLTYKSVSGPGDYTILDFPHRRIDFNDFLKVSGMHELRCVCTDLKVDRYYLGDLRGWIERLEAFYAQASLCV